MSFSSKVNKFHSFHKSPENLLAIAVLSFLLFLTIPYAHVLNKAVLHEKSLINQVNPLVSTSKVGGPRFLGTLPRNLTPP